MEMEMGVPCQSRDQFHYHTSDSNYDSVHLECDFRSRPGIPVYAIVTNPDGQSSQMEE